MARAAGRAPRAAPGELPTPTVHLEPDYLRRALHLIATLSAARERREGAGRGSLAGGGEEFVGFRPYRPGEDLRRLDWSLYARLDRPFVRVTRREAGERWAILLDASASMGAGPPGKLQRAAEVAGALALLGARLGADVTLLASDAGERERFELARRGDPRNLLHFLDGLRASGGEGARELLRHPRRFDAAGRVFLVGDLAGLEPRAFLELARRGRELFAVQVLAPLELEPDLAEGEAVEWWDPESDARLELRLERATVGAYQARLEESLELWRQAAARHGASFGSWSSALPFEAIVTRALGV